MVENKSRMDSRQIIATSDPTKPQKHEFSCYFPISGGSKKSRWSPHFSQQSIPGLFYSKPHRKVSATELELRTTNFRNRENNRPNCFQTLTFCWNLGFQKPRICPRQPPRGFYISRKDTQKQQNLGNCKNIKNHHFSIKWLPFLCLFLGPMPFFGPHGRGWGVEV